jgi:hypothetical protein
MNLMLQAKLNAAYDNKVPDKKKLKNQIDLNLRSNFF